MTPFNPTPIWRRWLRPARQLWRAAQTRWTTWRQAAAAVSEPAGLAGLRAEQASTRWQAAAALGSHPMRSAETIAALIQALADPEPIVRWHASEALAGQETSRVFPALAQALNAADPQRRAGAAAALGRLGGEAAGQALHPRLTDAAPAVRAAVAGALGQLKDPTATARLLTLLADREPEVICAAAQALGQTGDTQAAAAVAQRLTQPEQPLLVRRALAAALAHIPHPNTQEQLLVALRDPDPQVRGYIATALGQVGNEAALAPLQALLSDRHHILHGVVGDRARQALALLERRGRRGFAAEKLPEAGA